MSANRQRLPATLTTPLTAVNVADVSPETAEYVRRSRSDATQTAYRIQWRAFMAWAESKGREAMPADPQTVADYAAELAQAGAKLTTIQLKLAAVSNAHRATGARNPVPTELVRKTVQGIARTHGSARNKKAALSLAELRAMCVSLGDDTRGRRDRALLTLGFCGAFRRAELCSLDVADLRFTLGELIVTLRRSKTDQEGVGFSKRIPAATDPKIDPVKATRDWLELAGISSGPIFRGVDLVGDVAATRLTPRSVALIIKRAADRIGIPPGQFAGHSLRSGFITEAARRDVPEYAIMAVSGHRSSAIMRGYIHDAGNAQARAIRAVMG